MKNELTNILKTLEPFALCAKEGIVIHGLSGQIIFANESALQILGLTMDQLLGKTSLDPVWKTMKEDGSLFPGEEHPIMTTINTGESCQDVIMGVAKVNGEETWISINTKILNSSENTPIAALAMFSDITLNKKLENSLNESNDFLTSIINKLPGYVYQVKDDQKSTPIFISKNIEELTGYSDVEFINLKINYFDLINPEDKEVILKEIEFAKKNNITYDCDYRIKTKDGSEKWVKEKANFKINKQRKIQYWTGLVIDITQKKKIEHALLKRKNELKKLLNALPVAMYTTDESGNINFFNQAAETIWGRKPDLHHEKYCGSLRLFDSELNHIPHEDCPMGIAIRNKVEIHGKEAVLEQPNGSFINFLAHATPFFDGEGNFTGAMNVMVDITERKKSEQKLLTAESRFRSFADNAPIAMCIFKEDGTILMENKFSLTTYQDENSSNKESGVKFLFGKTVWEEVLNSNHTVASTHKKLTYDKTAFLNNQLKYFKVFKFPIPDSPKITNIGAIYMDVSELKKQEIELSLKENRLSSLLDSNSAYLIRINKQGLVTYHNKSYSKLISDSHQDQTGKSCLLNVSQEDHVHFFNVLHECIHEPGKIISLKLKIVNAESKPIFTTWEFVGIPDNSKKVFEIQAVGWNISDLIIQQEEINKLAQILQRTKNGVVITDTNGLVEWVNEGFTNMTEYSTEELLNTKPGNYLQGKESNPDTIRHMKKCILEKKAFNVDIVNYSKSKRKYWVNIDAEPVMNEEGEVLKFIAIETDITEKKEQEIILKQLVNDLILKNKNLEEFSYILSHNLRGPVANILGLVNLTRYELSEDDVKKIVVSLQKSTSQLDSVIKDVNQIISLQNISEIKENINVHQLITEIIEDFQPELSNIPHEIINEIDPQFILKSVRPYLNSIVYNLISNAIKYRKPDGKLDIRIMTKVDKNFIHLFIADNGIGIDLRQFKEKLFGMYKRFHLEIDGKGMGLFISKQQAEILGGSIDVQSTPNNGSVFVVTLPL